LLTSFQRTSPSPWPCEIFLNMSSFYGGELLALGPTVYRLSATVYSIHLQLSCTSGGLLLHPYPEDAPCRGDRDPLIMDKNISLLKPNVRHTKILLSLLFRHVLHFRHTEAQFITKYRVLRNQPQ
jgi:hypothetical protein